MSHRRHYVSSYCPINITDHMDEYHTRCQVLPESETVPGPPRELLWLPTPACEGVHDNPSVQEFVKNTQALRVINSFCKGPAKGNCRGGHNGDLVEKENSTEPLPKRPRRKSSTSKPLGIYCNDTTRLCVSPTVLQ